MAAVLRMSSNNPVFSGGRPTGGRHQHSLPRPGNTPGGPHGAGFAGPWRPLSRGARGASGVPHLKIRTLGARVDVLEGLQDLDGPVLLHLTQPHGQRGMALAVHLHHPRDRRRTPGSAPPRSSAHPCRRPFPPQPCTGRTPRTAGQVVAVLAWSPNLARPGICGSARCRCWSGRTPTCTCPPPCRPWSWPCLRRWPGCHSRGRPAARICLARPTLGLPPAVG